MIGRLVTSVWHQVTGTIVRWEPLLPGSTCDALVASADGSLIWLASHALQPTDGLGPLPCRLAAIKEARCETLESLKVIRAQHVVECQPSGRPWPGAEFGKAIIGRAIDGAIADLKCAGGQRG